MKTKFKILPLPLIQAIDTTVEEALNKSYCVDPLLGAEQSRAQSIMGSLIKRHGNIIEHAIEAAFKVSDYHTVVDTRRFKVSSAADRLTEHKPQDLKSFPDLLYFPDQGRNTSPDLVILDNRTCTAIAIEVKRANGPSDSGKKSQIIRDLQCMRMNVRSFVEQQGYHVRAGDAKIIEYYGKSGLPEEMSLNKDKLDAYFGLNITDFVDLSTEYLRRKIEKVLTTNTTTHAA